MPEYAIDDPDPAALAGRNADAMYRLVTGAAPGELRERVRALGGTRAAAQIAGVTQRTVQRWITQRGTQRIAAPRAATAARIDAAFTQARSTPAGREQIAAGRRQVLMRHQGATMRGNALAGPMTAGRERLYAKMRRFDTHVSSSVMAVTFDEFIAGGEEAGFFAFNSQFGDEYGGSGAYFDAWMFFDMGGLGFDPDVGRPS